MQIASIAIAFLFSFGAIFGIFIGTSSLADTSLGHFNIYYYLYSHNEPFIMTVEVVLLLLVFRYFRQTATRPRAPILFSWMPTYAISYISLAVFILTILGTWFVLHNYALSMDEHMANFQTKIFSRTQVWASIPDHWKEFGPALNPVFGLYDAGRGAWTSSYLPVYAAFRTPFMLVDCASLLNPCLAFGSVLMIAAVARKLWPDRPSAPLLSVIILATSSQFLLTSMTAYACETIALAGR
jgi:hypothetical protein